MRRLFVDSRSAHLCYRVLDNLLVRHIGLVAHQQLVDALGGVSVNLLQPLLHVVERVHVGDIVDDADAMCTAVVGRCDGSEALLPGRVPLQSLSAVCRLSQHGAVRTICSFTVLPSSSIVRIFCHMLAHRRLRACAGRDTHEINTDR
jgi:hypothetical protein